jgi:hypothetical protein
MAGEPLRREIGGELGNGLLGGGPLEGRIGSELVGGGLVGGADAVGAEGGEAGDHRLGPGEQQRGAERPEAGQGPVVARAHAFEHPPPGASLPFAVPDRRRRHVETDQLRSGGQAALLGEEPCDGLLVIVPLLRHGSRMIAVPAADIMQFTYIGYAECTSPNEG